MAIKWWWSPTGKILLAILLAEVVSSFELGLVYASMGAMYREFSDPVIVGWIQTSFLLVAAGTVAICGRLGDIYGRKRVIAWVLGLSFLGSLISAFSPTPEGVIFGRAIQGFSGAILPLCFGLVRETMPEKMVPMGFGAVIATANVSGAISVVLGGLVVDMFGWHAVFHLSALTAFLSLVVVLVWIPKSARSTPQNGIDWLGGILFAPSIAGILFGITKAKLWGWGDMRTLSVVGGSLLVLCIWVWHELRLKDPLINVRLLASPKILLTNICLAVLSIGAMQYGPLLSAFMQQPVWTATGLGLTATAAGIATFPAVLLGGLGGPWSAAVTARHNARRSMLTGTVLLTIGWGSIAIYHQSFLFIAVLMVPAMIGLAFVLSSVPALLMEVVPAERTSEANGLTGVFRHVFTAVGAQIIAFILALSSVTDSARGKVYPDAAAFNKAFALIGVASLVCVAIAFLLPGRRRSAAALEGLAAGKAK